MLGQVIHSDARGLVAELAFARSGSIEPHSSPNTSWLVVIEGGGWVGVGDERTRIAAGEAALWPADIPHGAWTDGSHMRALVIEFAGADDDAGILVGRARALEPGETLASRAEGRLTGPPTAPRHTDPDAGEPA
ncbi:MAG: cupin domain-containing protein [Candidatus Limnocylindrales bacterium]